MGQFFFDALVAAVQVVDPVDFGHSFGSQTSQDQRGAGPEIGGLHVRAGKFLNSVNSCSSAGHPYACPHTYEFLNMHETVFEDVLSNPGLRVSQGHESHVLGLKIRGKPRVRVSSRISTPYRPIGNHSYLTVGHLQFQSGFFKFLEQGTQMSRLATTYSDVAAGDRGGYYMSSRLNAVRHQLMSHSMERTLSLYHYGVSPCSGYAAAHFVDNVGEFHHFRLDRAVSENGGTIGQRRCHHEIFRAGNRLQVKCKVGSFQSPGACLYVTALEFNGRAHRFQAFEMLVDRPGSDGTTPGKAHVRPTFPGHQRAQNHNRSSHGFHKLIGGRVIGDLSGLDP